MMAKNSSQSNDPLPSTSLWWMMLCKRSNSRARKREREREREAAHVQRHHNHHNPPPPPRPRQVHTSKACSVQGDKLGSQRGWRNCRQNAVKVFACT
jgi:hypothetical protein